MRVHRLALVLVLALLVGGSTGCREEEGPAEKFGRQLDEAAQEAGGAFEEAGDALEDAAEEAKKKLPQE